MFVYFQIEHTFAGGSYPHVSFVFEHAGYFDVFSCHLVVKIKVIGLLIIAVYFILFPDEKAVFIIYAIDVSLQEGGEALGSQIELGNTFGTEQVDFSVLVACHAEHGVTEKAVGIVFVQFVSLYIVSIVTVQTFARSNP